MQTIEEYISAARILLQDVDGQRWDDANFRLGLTLAFMEARRIRPDMFLRMTPPDFLTADATTSVPAPDGYQPAFLYYICGHVQLSDQEDVTDQRATVFLNKFTAQLLATAA